MNRLADLRPGITDLDQAKNAMQEIAQTTCRLKYQKARVEKQITDIKAKLAEMQAADVAKLQETEKALSVFIAGHPSLFQKPRKVVTEFGSFGLQETTEVIIEDESRLMKHVIVNEFYDCFETVRTLIKKALRTRLEAKETLPGCVLKTGDTAVYKVAKTLVDEAKEKAVET